jgi:glyoxylate/hydroxypyruvate reductase A
MKVLLQVPAGDAARWHDALAAALPEAAIARWPEPCAAPDYALVWKPPAAVFAAVAPRRAIFNLGAGVDALLAVPGLPAAVPVIRLEDAGMAAQMADYVALHVLRAFRDADAYARQQREGRWEPRPPREKSSFAIGLLGYGVLGRAVGQTLAALGFPLHAWSRRPQSARGVTSHAGEGGLPAFLAAANVLVCLLPSTPATRGMLDRARLGRLPAGAHVINVARGDLVVDADLVALLDSGHLAGAVLDVFREEPLPAAHPFWHHPRIVVTPHVSAATLVEPAVAQIAAKIRRLEVGLPVTGVVDRNRGY